MEKKIIIFGAGYQGKKVLNHYGKEKVAFFCDNYKTGSVEGIPIINVEQLEALHQSYEVEIAIESADVVLGICEQLAKRNIPYRWHFTKKEEDGLLHIHGVYPDLKYDYKKEQPEVGRIEKTIKMYKKMFFVYHNCFVGKKLDIWFFAYDEFVQGEFLRLTNAIHNLHMYYTVYPYRNKIIPIPDYRACYDLEDYLGEETPDRCLEKAKESWTDPRAFWIGTPFFSDGRRMLVEMGRQYPEYLDVRVNIRMSPQNYIPMLEQVKYKYLIDVRGQGWTDRLKILLQLGRPVLIVDRPFKEWYFDELEPMKHYVPVKEDMSDLIEKIQYLNEHEDVYQNIVENALDFSAKHFWPEAVLEYLKNVTLKYDVMEE